MVQEPPEVVERPVIVNLDRQGNTNQAVETEQQRLGHLQENLLAEQQAQIEELSKRCDCLTKTLAKADIDRDELKRQLEESRAHCQVWERMYDELHGDFRQTERKLLDEVENLKGAKKHLLKQRTEMTKQARRLEKDLALSKVLTGLHQLCSDWGQREREDLQRERDKVQRELTEMKAANTSSSSARTTSYGDAVVEYLENDQWVKYDAGMVSEALRAWSSGKRTAKVHNAGRHYKLDFDKMTQTNTQTKTIRSIRARCCLPDHWTLDLGDVLGNWKRNLALQNPKVWRLGAFPTDEWDDVAHEWTDSEWTSYFTNLLSESVFHEDAWAGEPTPCDHFEENLRVSRVWHIENMNLLQDYQQKALRLSEQHREDEVELSELMEVVEELEDLELKFSLDLPSQAQERFLFHGATLEKIKQIVLKGFDHRCAGRASYGFGTYFASQACKSWQYSTSPGQTRGFIVVARVALGKPFYATRVPKNAKDQFRRPPAGHDSVLAQPGFMPGHRQGADHQTHCEYVIFDNAQAYPEFVLQVETL